MTKLTGFFTKTYLVQYGQFNDGRVVEAASEISAVQKVLDEAPYFNMENLKYDFKVFEVAKEGKVFVIDSSLKVKPKEK